MSPSALRVASAPHQKFRIDEDDEYDEQDEEGVTEETNSLLPSSQSTSSHTPNLKSKSSLTTYVISAFVVVIFIVFSTWRHSVNVLEIDTPSQLVFRTSNNVIYWTPRKTGSSSMRAWLNKIISRTGIGMQVKDPYKFVYTSKRDWYDLAEMRSFHNASNMTTPHCSVVYGHIRALPYTERRDERKLERLSPLLEMLGILYRLDISMLGMKDLNKCSIR